MVCHDNHDNHVNCLYAGLGRAGRELVSTSGPAYALRFSACTLKSVSETGLPAHTSWGRPAFIWEQGTRPCLTGRWSRLLAMANEAADSAAMALEPYYLVDLTSSYVTVRYPEAARLQSYNWAHVNVTTCVKIALSTPGGLQTDANS